jgi:hypothetical protein
MTSGIDWPDPMSDEDEMGFELPDDIDSTSPASREAQDACDQEVYGIQETSTGKSGEQP